MQVCDKESTWGEGKPKGARARMRTLDGRLAARLEGTARHRGRGRVGPVSPSKV
jgi:hypothetical protein